MTLLLLVSGKISYYVVKNLERSDWLHVARVELNKGNEGSDYQLAIMRRRPSLGCRVAGNDAGVWGAEAQK